MKKEKLKVTKHSKSNHDVKIESLGLGHTHYDQSHNLIQNQIQAHGQNLFQIKIVKQFQIKRKLLMKAFKQKVKENKKKQLHFKSSQTKEGADKDSTQPQKNHTCNTKITLQRKVSKQNCQSVCFRPIQENIQAQTTLLENKVNVGIQASIKFLKTKKIQKIIHTVKANQENAIKSNKIKNIFRKHTNTIPEYDRKEFQNLKEPLIKSKNEKKTKEELQNIKIQITKKLFNANTNLINLRSSLEENLTRLKKVIDIKNQAIENYYRNKKLKRIIIQHLSNSINNSMKNKRKQKQKNLDLETSESKSDQSSRQGKSRSISLRFNQRGNEIQKKKKRIIRRTKRNRQKSTTPRLINQRFKQALISTDNQKQIVNFKSITSNNQSSIGSLSQLCKQNESESFQNWEKLNSIKAWKEQFEELSSRFLHQYPNLQFYVSGKKTIDYEKIINQIRTEAKQFQQIYRNKKICNSNKLKIFRKQSSKDQSFFSNIWSRSSKSTQRNKKKVAFSNSFFSNKLKQINFAENQEDQLGRSFDLREYQKPKDQSNFRFQEIIDGEIFNSLLKASTQKSGQQYVRNATEKGYLDFMDNSNNFGSDFDQFLNEHQRKDFSISEQSTRKIRIRPVLEWSLFNGQQGKQHLYMSQEIE